ncbi:MAG: AEC family transporter [Emergencia sp.]
MLRNLLFCLNATIPVFLLMILGMVFMKLHIFDEDFVKKMNAFVFKAALPVLVFYDLCKEDFYEVWDTKYVLFCFLATALSIGLVTAVSFLLKDRSVQGEFIQVAYRSSAAIMGVALIQNLYGSSGMTPLMIIGSVPLYNIFAVIVLTFFRPQREPMDRKLLAETAKGIVTNPIILGIVFGLGWSLLQIPMPAVLDKTVENVARLATPLGLMAMGATFDIKKALSGIRTAGLGAFIKLIGLGCIFLPAAAALGFRGEKLAAALIMCGSPTTVSCYVMAKNMGHEGTLTSSTVMLTTFFSAFTLTGWLFVLKSLGLL